MRVKVLDRPAIILVDMLNDFVRGKLKLNVKTVIAPLGRPAVDETMKMLFL